MLVAIDESEAETHRRAEADNININKTTKIKIGGYNYDLLSNNMLDNSHLKLEDIEFLDLNYSLFQ